MIIAVDTGGTKTLVARFSKRGTLETSIKHPTPQDTASYIELLRTTIADISGDEAIDIISIGMPDVQDATMVHHFTNLPWKDFDVVFSLSKHFPRIPIILANDANLGGLGEVRSMSRPPKRALYITVSTGIGTGVITDGHIDPAFINSEGGHILLDYDGTIRTWQNFASGKAIVDIYGKQGSEIRSPRIWNQIADRISRGILALTPVIQPDTIIIGGGMGLHFPKYGQQLISILNRYLTHASKKPVLIQAKNPEFAVIYGCYYYAIDHLTTQ